jgi:hypothetical protein
MKAPAKLASAILPIGDPIEAVQLLHHILQGDHHGRTADGLHFVLLEIDAWLFDRLCAWAADAADFEDGGDEEPDDDDEPTLGRTNRLAQPDEPSPFLDGESEPSLGLTSMLNQKRWAEGARDDDREFDRSALRARRRAGRRAR